MLDASPYFARSFQQTRYNAVLSKNWHVRSSSIHTNRPYGSTAAYGPIQLLQCRQSCYLGRDMAGEATLSPQSALWLSHGTRIRLTGSETLSRLTSLHLGCIHLFSRELRYTRPELDHRSENSSQLHTPKSPAPMSAQRNRLPEAPSEPKKES